MPSRDTAAACDPSSLKCMPSHPPMPPFDVWRDRDWQGSHRARDSRAQPAPKPVEGCGIAMFAGNVHLPCDAVRIPAARYGRDLSCPCKSTTCNRWALACDLHHSQRERYDRGFCWKKELDSCPRKAVLAGPGSTALQLSRLVSTGSARPKSDECTS